MSKTLTKDNLLESIKEETDNFNKSLRINPSFAPNQREIIDLCDYYYMSKYRDGDTDNLGQHKVFYNIVVLPVEVASKQLDLDTKNIRLQGEGDSYWLSWVKGKELGLWMKEKYFGRQLNLYPVCLAKYGHLFLKKVGNDVMMVNPKQIIVRPDVENLSDTPILEQHKMPKDAFYALAEKRGWENYKLTSKEEKDTNDIEFYEMFFPDGFYKSKENYFVVRPGGEAVMAYLQLDQSPYKALAWEKIPGRFLGRGQVEKLFEDQIYLNRIANYKAEGLNWTSKHLYQTRDENFRFNLFSDTDNGDVLAVKSEITPVAMEERNLGFYSYEEVRWENMALRKAFTSEPVTGERAPSGTPLGSTMLQAQMTAGYYDQKKEDLGSFIEEVIWDWVLPEFEKANSKEHEVTVRNLLSSTDDNSDKFFKFLLADRMNKLRARDGLKLTEEQWKIREGIQSDLLKKSPLKMEKGSYGNLKEKIMIDIVGEHIDTPAKLSTLQVLIQMLGSNPQILRDPVVKKILFKTLDLAGFNPHDFDFEEDASTMSAVQQVAPRSGSVARTPNTAQLPTSIPQLAYSSK